MLLYCWLWGNISSRGEEVTFYLILWACSNYYFKKSPIYKKRRKLALLRIFWGLKTCSFPPIYITAISYIIGNSISIYSIACVLSRVQLFATLWPVVLQTPLSMEFSRQEYWSGWPFPSPGNLPDPGIELETLASPALECRFFSSWATRGVLCVTYFFLLVLLFERKIYPRKGCYIND